MTGNGAPNSGPATGTGGGEGRAYVLGGNASTLAFVASLRPVNKQVTAWLVPLAWTPIGAVIGDNWQKVNVGADNLPGWVDQTFPQEDERAFVTSLRETEMLVRAGWHSETPQQLSEQTLLNPEDVPDDVLDAIEHPALPLTQCNVCRRTCVRDDFLWNERQLCAWDYHAIVFGKRGPWRNEPYEDRLFETIPQAAYIAPALLAEVEVEAVLATADLDESLQRELVNTTIAREPADYLAARTPEGLTLLRERRRPPAP